MEPIDKLAAALSAAQGTWENPKKDGFNPHFQSRYATLDALQNATRKGLSDNKLAVVQLPQPMQDGGWVLETVLIHASGQYMISRLPLDASKGPQVLGSWITYMQRYGYKAILNISAEEEDDAEHAQSSYGTTKPAGKEYKLNPAAQATVLPASVQSVALPSDSKHVQTGRVTGITESSEGGSWFVDIAGFSFKGSGKTVWTKDVQLAESLAKDQGRVVEAHMRVKRAGSYQLLSYVPAEDQSQ